MCLWHQMRNRRFGDPSLTGCLKRSELKPYLIEVRRLCARGHEERTEHVFSGIQQRLRELAESTLAERLNAAAQGREWFRRAEEEIVRVTADANPVEAAHLIGALFLMRERVPRRWPTERAFRFDVVRAWRKLAGISYGSAWDHRLGKMRRMYRELRPRVVETVAEWLVTAYAPLVARLRAAARADVEEPKTFSDALAAALWPSFVQSLLTTSGAK